MSTWHQRQNMPQLWHATLWTLVVDPPEETLTIQRFKDPVEAQRQMDRLVKAHVERELVKYGEGHDREITVRALRRSAHVYILPPQP